VRKFEVLELMSTNSPYVLSAMKKESFPSKTAKAKQQEQE